MNVSANLLDTD